MMSEIIEYMEAHAGFIGVVSSLCMLLVTSIYAGITWWQAVNSKKTLLASVKQHRGNLQDKPCKTRVSPSSSCSLMFYA